MGTYMQDGDFLIANEGYRFIMINDPDFDCTKIMAKYLEYYECVPIDNYIEPAWNEWQIGIMYKKDDVCIYNEKRYKCLQDHLSMDNKTPENTFNYWIEI